MPNSPRFHLLAFGLGSALVALLLCGMHQIQQSRLPAQPRDQSAQDPEKGTKIRIGRFSFGMGKPKPKPLAPDGSVDSARAAEPIPWFRYVGLGFGVIAIGPWLCAATSSGVERSSASG